MNNEDNITNFLQELIFLEKDLAQQLKQYQNRQANNAVMHNPIKIDHRLEKILDNLADPVKTWIAKQNTETKQGQMIINLATNIINLQKTREDKLLKEFNQLLKENANELIIIKNKIGNNNKRIGTARQESKIPREIWAIATDSKGNVYIGTREASWNGGVYKCLAGESEFKPMLGVNGEVWTIVLDKNENIYVGTREGNDKGDVYKCLVNQNSFKKVKGINKCVSYLKFDGDILYAKVWTGPSLKIVTYKGYYKCLPGESEFKPALSK